jgi:Outer membrane efflux protein
MTYRRLVLAIITVVGLFGTAAAEKVSGNKAAPGTGQVSKANSDLARAAAQYKASVEALLPHCEESVKAATEALEKRRELLEKGLVSKRDIDTAEQALKDAQAQLDQVRHQLTETDQLIAEASVEPAKPAGGASTGRYASKSAVMRYSGAGGWAIAEAAKVQGFFTSQFGKQLPISAFGQSETHNRLGFNHRNSVDVALHPDSAEGKALIEYLRSNGIPFLAFRSAIPGVATGAHIHIGYPSHRI